MLYVCMYIRVFWCNVTINHIFTKINPGLRIVWWFGLKHCTFVIRLMFSSSLFFRLFSTLKWMIDRIKQTIKLWGTVKFLSVLLTAQSSNWLTAFLQQVNYICFILRILKKCINHSWIYILILILWKIAVMKNACICLHF